jgi:hypothetical protein
MGSGAALQAKCPEMKILTTTQDVIIAYSMPYGEENQREGGSWAIKWGGASSCGEFPSTIWHFPTQDRALFTRIVAVALDLLYGNNLERFEMNVTASNCKISHVFCSINIYFVCPSATVDVDVDLTTGNFKLRGIPFCCSGHAVRHLLRRDLCTTLSHLVL